MATSSDRRIRIVIADDHAGVRRQLRSLLEDRTEFAVVGEASNGLEAIDLARTVGPDVVVMDVSMPHLDGIEATRRIRAECPRVLVFGLSTEEHARGVHPIETAGAAGYFSKHGDVQRLVARLLAVHAARSQPSG